MAPVPDEIEAHDASEMQEQKRAGQYDSVAYAQCQVGQHEGNGKHPEQQQRFVEHAGEATADAGQFECGSGVQPW
jgi:hypothetical protein